MLCAVGPPGHRTVFGTSGYRGARSSSSGFHRWDRLGKDVIGSLASSLARALVCLADMEFRVQVVIEAIVTCSQSKNDHLFCS